MELGSQVCTPRNPRCEACPLAALCPTRRYELAGSIPAARPRPVIESVSEAAVVVRRGSRILLVQRQAKERWAGLWDFPRIPLAPAADSPIEGQLIDGVHKRTGIKIRPGALLTTIRHSVTRYRISLECHEAVFVSKATRGAGRPEMRWVRPKELADSPLSTSARKLARLIATAAADSR